MLDAGNSRVKWRLGERQGACASGDLAPDGPPPWEDGAIRVAVVACVAGAEVERSLRALLARGRVEAHWLASPDQAHGIVNHYRIPASLGVDRFAGLVAVHRQWPGDWLVASVGTALTVDALAAGGHFLGGCILPGPELMRAALAQGTAGVRVPWAAADADMAAAPAFPGDWPRSTAEAVRQGIGLAAQGVVQGLAARFTVATGRAPGIVLAGGGRGAVRPYLSGRVVEVDELVLEGLTWIARDLGYDV